MGVIDSNKKQPFHQRGFTLVEFVVTIGIAGILFSIAVGAWGNMRDNTRVDSAKERVVSILQQARLKALSSGITQTVSVNAPADVIVDSTGQSNDFSLNNITIQKFVCTGCAADNTVVDTITFTRRGTAVNKNILITAPGSNRQFIVMVNGVTGRVDVRTRCVSPTCLP